MDHVTVTRHAEHRMRERLGITKSAVQGAADRAYQRGAQYADTSGGLRHYLDAQRCDCGRDYDWRIYGEHLYAFSKDKILITIFPITKHFQNRVKKKN